MQLFNKQLLIKNVGKKVWINKMPTDPSSPLTDQSTASLIDDLHHLGQTAEKRWQKRDMTMAVVLTDSEASAALQVDHYSMCTEEKKSPHATSHCTSNTSDVSYCASTLTRMVTRKRILT